MKNLQAHLVKTSLLMGIPIRDDVYILPHNLKEAAVELDWRPREQAAAETDSPQRAEEAPGDLEGDFHHREPAEREEDYSRRVEEVGGPQKDYPRREPGEEERRLRQRQDLPRKAHCPWGGRRCLLPAMDCR